MALMLLAVFMLLAVPYIPHHHHHGTVCTSMEHCPAKDGDDCRHRGHKGDTSLCIEDEEYMISKYETWYATPHPAFLPILATTANPVVNGDIVPTLLRDHGNHATAHLHSTYIARALALRAPPGHQA